MGKGSDQTARMHRLVWAPASGIYHIVGNFMHWLSHVNILLKKKKKKKKTYSETVW